MWVTPGGQVLDHKPASAVEQSELNSDGSDQPDESATSDDASCYPTEASPSRRSTRVDQVDRSALETVAIWVRRILFGGLALAFVSFSLWGLLQDKTPDSGQQAASERFDRSGLDMVGFSDAVRSRTGCADLFVYRNELERVQPEAAEEMNAVLSRIGCSTSESQRTDLDTDSGSTRAGSPHPSISCEAAFASQAGRSVELNSTWAVVATSGNRRLLWRPDGNYESVRLCDLEFEGSYSAPISSNVFSVFTMASVGRAPDEELPTEADMFRRADSLR